MKNTESGDKKKRTLQTFFLWVRFFYQIFFELRFRQISTILNVWSILIAKTSSVMNFQTFPTSHFKRFSDLVFEKKTQKNWKICV